MPLVLPVGESKPPVVFIARFVRMLFGTAFVMFAKPFVFVPIVVEFVNVALEPGVVLPAPPVIVTPKPAGRPMPVGTVPVVATLGCAGNNPK